MTKRTDTQGSLRHLAVIMDGNGRWALSRGKARMIGHRAGWRALTQLLPALIDHKIPCVTFYAFSQENWSRPRAEVAGLMQLFSAALRHQLRAIQRQEIAVRFIGERAQLSDRLQTQLAEAEKATASGERLTMNIALNYSGRWELLDAINRLLAKSAETATEAQLESLLPLCQDPPVDFLIRTGGEQRLSNFLLWHIGYTELYFSKTLWPEFDRAALERALQDYRQRKRRFGGLHE